MSLSTSFVGARNAFPNITNEQSKSTGKGFAFVKPFCTSIPRPVRVLRFDREISADPGNSEDLQIPLDRQCATLECDRVVKLKTWRNAMCNGTSRGFVLCFRPIPGTMNYHEPSCQGKNNPTCAALATRISEARNFVPRLAVGPRRDYEIRPSADITKNYLRVNVQKLQSGANAKNMLVFDST